MTERPVPMYAITEEEITQIENGDIATRKTVLHRSIPAVPDIQGKHEPHWIQCKECQSLIKVPVFPDHDAAVRAQARREIHNRLQALATEAEGITCVTWADIDCLFAELGDAP
jgi:hypothetical protein